MTLNQLHTLLAVADAGSVRLAAGRLVVSQPAVSGAIASLEKELGVKLVGPKGRGLEFTPAGEAFVSSVRAGIALLDRAVREAKSIEAPGRGTVRVSAVTTAAEHLLLPLLAEFRRSYPEAELVVSVGNRTTVWEALREAETDLVVAGRPPAALGARTLGRADNRLILVGAPPEPGQVGGAGRARSGPGGRLRPGLDSLGRTTWLLREEGSGTREATDELLNQLGIDPPRLILGSNGAVEQAAIAGLGVALISEVAVAGSLATDRLAAYECLGTPLVRPWHLVARSLGSLTPTVAMAVRSMLTVRSGFVPTADGRRLLRN